MTLVPDTLFNEVKIAGYDAKLYFVDAEKDDYRLFAEFDHILVYWDTIESRKSPTGYDYTYRYTLSGGTINVVKYLEVVNYSEMLENLFGMHDTYKTEIHFQVKNRLAKLKNCTPIPFTLEKISAPEKISIDSYTKWDSLRHFDLIANLEKEFNIEIKPNDIMKLKSFKDGILILKKYKIKI